MLGNQGQTSLTGKNAFAVLKPSAIASASTVMFPNNFTNLPKVHPPFLDPLEPSESPIYTLVLDLDETLIHNVEVSCHPEMIALLTLFCTFLCIVLKRQLFPRETWLRPVHRDHGQVLRDRDLHCSAAGVRRSSH